MEVCTNSRYASGTIGIVVNEHEVLGCDPVETAASEEEVTTAAPATLMREPITTPPPPSCPQVPSYGPIPALAAPEITPTTAVNRDCVEYDPQRLQHCSLFGLSVLRPFRSYRSGLEVCNIPGSWFLLRHRTVTVEVEGVASGENFDHTRLSKVSRIIICISNVCCRLFQSLLHSVK